MKNNQTSQTSISNILGQINHKRGNTFQGKGSLGTGTGMGTGSGQIPVSNIPFYLVLNIYQGYQNPGYLFASINPEILAHRRGFCAYATKIALDFWQQNESKGVNYFNAYLTSFASTLSVQYANLTNIEQVDFAEVAACARETFQSVAELAEIWEQVSKIDTSNFLNYSDTGVNARREVA